MAHSKSPHRTKSNLTVTKAFDKMVFKRRSDLSPNTIQHAGHHRRSRCHSQNSTPIPANALSNRAPPGTVMIGWCKPVKRRAGV